MRTKTSQKWITERKSVSNISSTFPFKDSFVFQKYKCHPRMTKERAPKYNIISIKAENLEHSFDARGILHEENKKFQTSFNLCAEQTRVLLKRRMTYTDTHNRQWHRKKWDKTWSKINMMDLITRSIFNKSSGKKSEKVSQLNFAFQYWIDVLLPTFFAENFVTFRIETAVLLAV